MFQRFSHQLFWGNLVILLFVFGIGFFWTFHENRRLHEEVEKNLLSEIVEIVVKDLELNESNVQERIDLLDRIFVTRKDLRLTVVDTQGHVLGDSETDSQKMDQHLTTNRPEILAALDGNFGQDIRKSQTMGIPYRYIALPLKKGEQITGAVRVAYPYSKIKSQEWEIYETIFVRFLLMFVSIFGLFFLLSQIWMRPLRQLADSSRSLAEGNLATPIPVSGPLELQQLALSLDRMRKTVSAQLNTIRNQQEDLKSILTNLKEAIIMLDASDHIVFVNPAASVFLHLEQTSSYEGKPLQNVLRQGTILSIFDRLRASHTATSEIHDVEIDGKRLSLEIEVIPISRKKDFESDFMIIVRDHSELIRTAKMKADFVANASHELRTPITALRTAADNLLDIVSLETRTVNHAEDESLVNISSILDRHISRLDLLVRDLLDFYSVENPEIVNRESYLQPVGLKTSLEELFGKRAKEKEIDLIVNIVDETAKIRTDENRLFLVLQNLLDNAIKFTPNKGRIHFDITVTKTGGLKIVCEDSGCGISQEDQKRLFERFYQAKSSKTGDSRSRGTGLGLAIVKHAVERLHGKIQVKSEIGYGTTIMVSIPNANY